MSEVITTITVIDDSGIVVQLADSPTLVTAAELPAIDVTVAEVGIQGAPGPDGPAGTVVETAFGSAAATWTVTHNLGRHPVVQVFDAAGAQFDADIEYADLNTVVVTHASPITGSVLIV